MLRHLALAALLLCLAAPAPAQEADARVLTQTLRNLGEGSAKELRDAALQRWLQFCERPHSEAERATILELWEAHSDPEARAWLLLAMRLDEDERFMALRRAVVKDPPGDTALAYAMSGIAVHGEATDATDVARYFDAESGFVRFAALDTFAALLDRFEAARVPLCEPGKRAPRAFKGFVPLVDKRLQDESWEVRAAALRAAAADVSPEVRYIVAEVALRCPELRFAETLIRLIGDPDEPVAGRATLALHRRLDLSRAKPQREAALAAIAADRASEDSIIAGSPMILLRLAELQTGQNRALAAIECARAAAVASREGGLEPPEVIHHIGATARLYAADQLFALGKVEEAQRELIDAHFDFHELVEVRLSDGQYVRLGVALKTIAKAIGGPKVFPPAPPRPRPQPKRQGSRGIKPSVTPKSFDEEGRRGESGVRLAEPAGPYGEALPEEGAPRIPVAALIAEPEAYKGKRVRLIGSIREVCPSIGCWFVIEDKGATLRIELEDAGFSLPLNSGGFPLTLEAVVDVEEGELRLKVAGILLHPKPPEEPR